MSPSPTFSKDNKNSTKTSGKIVVFYGSLFFFFDFEKQTLPRVGSTVEMNEIFSCRTVNPE